MGHLIGKCLSSLAKMSNGLILTASVSVYFKKGQTNKLSLNKNKEVRGLGFKKFIIYLRAK